METADTIRRQAAVAAPRSSKSRRLIYLRAAAVLLAVTGLTVVALSEFAALNSGSTVDAINVPAMPSVRVSVGGGRRENSSSANPTYPLAPAPGSAFFETPPFAELAGPNGSPGTRAARALLIRTKDGNVGAAEAEYNGQGTSSFTSYERAVLLNTVAGIEMRDPRLLEKAAFLRFYRGNRLDALPFGIVLSGVTPTALGRAEMHPSGFLGLLGRRSPRVESVASLEATYEASGYDTYAFDVDLYNPKADPIKHTAETDFNHELRVTTHPADVARALRMRGIVSGVTTE